MARLQPARSSGVSNITGDQLRFGGQVSLSADGATFAFGRETFGPILRIDISGGSHSVLAQRSSATYEYSAFDELTPISIDLMEAAVRETINDFDDQVAEVIEPRIEIVPFDLFSGLGLPALDQPTLSADGRILAFVREGAIVVADLEAGVSALPMVASTAEAGTVPMDAAAAGFGSDPTLSGAGTRIAFVSDDPTILAAAGLNARGKVLVEPAGEQVVVKDLTTGELTLVSADQRGQPGDGPSSAPSFSGNGRLVAFSSEAENLVRRDGNGAADVFVKDLRSGRIKLVSSERPGTPGDGSSRDPELSGDGRWVAFTSDADNLVEGDLNGIADVFVKDLRTGRISLASTEGDGSQRGVPSEATAISHDGRFVGFLSKAEITSGQSVVSNAFVKDMETGSLFQVDTLAINPVEPAVLEISVTDLALSGDGRTVAFAEASRDFRLPGDPDLDEIAAARIAAFFTDGQDRALEFIQVDAVGIGLLVPLQPDGLALLDEATTGTTEVLTLQPDAGPGAGIAVDGVGQAF